jgi:hypothetical protein
LQLAAVTEEALEQVVVNQLVADLAVLEVAHKVKEVPQLT